MATGRLAFALNGRASHHGCSVSAGVAAAGCMAARAPRPPAPVLMKALRPSPDDRDDGSLMRTPNFQLPTPNSQAGSKSRKHTAWKLGVGRWSLSGADGSTWNE